MCVHPVARQPFGRQMRHVLEVFLPAAGRPPHALAQPDQRIDDQRRGRHDDQREGPVVVKQQARKEHDGQRLTRQIGNRFRHRVLDLPDVVRDPGHQLAGGPAGEECGGLVEDVPEELVAERHHHPLADVGHEVGGGVAAHAHEQVGRHDLHGDEGDGPGTDRRHEDLVEDGLDAGGEIRRARGVDDHGAERDGQPAAIGGGDAQQAQQGVHVGII
jgi:hypothetical protein